MDVIITGGAGFIGSYLAEKFHEEGFGVHVIDNLFRGRIENIEGVIGGRNKFYNIDMVDSASVEQMQKIFMDNLPKYILHYAAINGTQYFYDIPTKVLNDNLKMTQNLLEALKRAKEEVDELDTTVVYASSSEVYGEPESIPTSESDLTYFRVNENRDSYSASKLVNELLVRLTCEEIGVRWINLRLFNVYGNRMVGTKYGQVIPEFINRLRDGEYPLTILGDGKHSRSFCHVSDNVEVTYKLTMSGITNQTFNIGNDVEVTILDIAGMVFKALGLDESIKHLPARKGDHLRRRPDTSKVKKVIGDYSYIQVEEGIKLMVENIVGQGR